MVDGTLRARASSCVCCWPECAGCVGPACVGCVAARRSSWLCRVVCASCETPECCADVLVALVGLLWWHVAVSVDSESPQRFDCLESLRSLQSLQSLRSLRCPGCVIDVAFSSCTTASGPEHNRPRSAPHMQGPRPAPHADRPPPTVRAAPPGTSYA